MAFMRCILCGRLAGNTTKAGDWVCSKCARKYAGFGKWMKMRNMSTEEILALKSAKPDDEEISPKVLKTARIKVIATVIVILASVVAAIIAIGACERSVSLEPDRKVSITKIINLLYFVVLIGALIFGVPSARIIGKYKKSRGKTTNQLTRQGVPVNQMTGVQFENYCASLLKRRYGFVRVETTKTSNDYGGDLIGYHKDGSKWVIQCKRYSSHVGNSAVQEVVAAKAHYRAENMAIMTNNQLTSNATTLAKENGVSVIENIN